MSETRKLIENQAKNLGIFAKICKWIGWFFIVLGALFIVTIIGAPVGISLVILGVGVIFIPKLLPKNFQGSLTEQAEIIEHQLRQARESKKD